MSTQTIQTEELPTLEKKAIVNIYDNLSEHRDLYKNTC